VNLRNLPLTSRTIARLTPEFPDAPFCEVEDQDREDEIHGSEGYVALTHRRCALVASGLSHHAHDCKGGQDDRQGYEDKDDGDGHDLATVLKSGSGREARVVNDLVSLEAVATDEDKERGEAQEPKPIAQVPGSQTELPERQDGFEACQEDRPKQDPPARRDGGLAEVTQSAKSDQARKAAPKEALRAAPNAIAGFRLHGFEPYLGPHSAAGAEGHS
jgi:hypothetical protein